MPPSLPCDPAQLDEFLSRPTDGVIETLQRHQGDILIAGAGGKMGGTLSLMLARAAAAAATPPRKIFAVSRFSNPNSRALLENHGITTLSADLIDRHAVAALPDAPLVFFMAGQKFGTADQPELTWAMNTVVPAIAAERWQNSRIVAFSTGCVYSMVPPDSGGATEDSPTNPPGEYAHSCLGREGVFRFFSNRFNTPTALVRLNYSVECRYGVLTDIARRILDGQPVDVSSGWVNVIWQRDACAHAIQCLDAAASPAVPVNITGQHTLPVRELAAALAQRLGRSVHFTGSEHPAAGLLHGAPTLGKPTHFEAADGKF